LIWSTNFSFRAKSFARLKFKLGAFPKKGSLLISVELCKIYFAFVFRSKFILHLFGVQNLFCIGVIEIDNDPFFGNAPVQTLVFAPKVLRAKLLARLKFKL